MKKHILEGVTVLDNVTVILTDTVTGKTRSFSSHNTPLEHAFSVFSQWSAGVNNTGQNAVPGPTMIALGSGTGTPQTSDKSLFAPIPGATASLSYAQANTPSNGTTTYVFQIAAGVVTTEVTEAFLQDVNSIGFAHTMFGTPFTPTSTETITIQWQLTFSP
ncbi:MAG: hypothetical protein K6T83_03255 [Alicyclobacillus sp.]|nr:hypothetical protein [Alicyclobacillus sp.]